MTPDQRLQSLNRADHADPQDPSAAIRYLTERSRVEGDGVWLELLADRETWNAQPPEAQDAAIAVVGQRLGVAYELAGVRVWECAGRKPCCLCRYNTSPIPCGGCDGRGVPGSLSHRLATFRHKAAGMELNLLPGVREDFKFEEEGCPECGECRGHGLIEGNPCDECGGVGTLPLHVPAIKPLLFGRYPVTEGQVYKADKGAKLGASLRGRGDESGLPAVGFAHGAASRFLSSIGMRLPLGSEWEHGCRAGSTTRFFWGDEMDDRFCWHAGNSGDSGRVIGHVTGVIDGGYLSVSTAGGGVARIATDRAVQEVGSAIYSNGDGTVRFGRPRPHAPSEHDAAGRFNAFGLVDTWGNVFEWIEDGGAMGGCYGTEDIGGNFQMSTHFASGLTHGPDTAYGRSSR